MKGTLHKTEQGWIVEYAKHSELPLHPDDVKQIEEDAKVFDNIEARIAAYPDVKFEIVNVWEGGMYPYRYAKLIPHAKLIPSKEQQKQLITEIMNQDAKDGLYEDDVWKVGLEDELNKLPYTKHLDDGQYNDGQLVGFELGATWGYKKAQETLYTEEQVREAINLARVKTDKEYYAKPMLRYSPDEIIQSLKQPKKD
jgi:hypothetical protein